VASVSGHPGRGIRHCVIRYANSAGGTPRRVPEVESPEARTDEQEVASGRTAATPVAMIATVVAVIAAAVVIVGALVVLGFALA
jgi:hypothetical protein